MRITSCAIIAGTLFVSSCSSPPLNRLDVPTPSASRSTASNDPNATTPQLRLLVSSSEGLLPIGRGPNGELPPAESMPAVEVKKPTLVPYLIFGILSAENPDYGTFILREERASSTASAVLWSEPGHWNEQIVAVEGKDVTSLPLRDQSRLRKSVDPVLLTVRARSGRLSTIECYSRPRDVEALPLRAQISPGPVRRSP
jgi:hypothetical protein